MHTSRLRCCLERQGECCLCFGTIDCFALCLLKLDVVVEPGICHTVFREAGVVDWIMLLT